jgi:hypothetical protein
MKIKITILLLPLALLAAVPTVSAQNILYGSGENVDMASHVVDGGWGNCWSGVVTDPNWQVVAVPSGFPTGYGNLSSGDTVPYSAYVPHATPDIYIGGNTIGGLNGTTDPNFGAYQAGVTIGDNNYRWIAPRADCGALVQDPYADYNWIAAQTFTVSQAGFYNFDFQGAGDNYMSFFINGSIDTTADPMYPTIDGGTQIGGTVSDFGTLHDFIGTAYLNAGANTAYMMIHDTGGQTAALIGESTFGVVPTPEPSTMALAALGGASLLWFRRRK